MSTAEVTPEKKERWSFSWKHLYDEVVTSGLCTGCAGCVIACPHDVLGYDDTERHVQADPDRGLRRPGRLQPRRQGVHLVHPRLPALPRVGARDRQVHVRPRAHAGRGVGRLQGHLPRPRRRPRAARGRPGRRARLRDARVRARARHHRRRARVVPRRRRHLVEGDPGHRTHPRRRDRVRRAAATRTPPTRSPTRISRRKTSASRSSACRASRRSRR